MSFSIRLAIVFYSYDRLWWSISIYTIVLAGIFSGLLVMAIKYVVQRVRPFHLFPVIHPLGPGGGWFFPSGYTSNAFFLAAILWLTYPNRRLLVAIIYLWATFFVISRFININYLILI